MQHEDDIELQIWQYLDGSCSEEARQHISMLIQNDPQWIVKYKELNVLHHALNEQLSLEQPPMRFTRNVMEAVTHEQIMPAANAYLNKWIIRGIAAFFLIIITALLTTTFEFAGQSSGKNMIRFSLPEFHFPVISWSAWSYGLLLLNVVAVLILIDTLLGRRKKQKTAV